ncbi:PAS domain S-box protein [Halogeometricum borinquense]|uniref:PAS domain S-box protein n=1 Tax=Halogeometricum borinquense TaxID=60847 RepID=A0A482T6R7_9EURY|nr:PAS domain S-box protein [Halogeometricum borinquense]
MTQMIAVFPFVAGALCASVTIIVLLRYRFYARRVRIPFAVLNLACAIWATAYGFQLMVPLLGEKLLWFSLWQVAAAFTPTLWFVFTLVYAGDETILSRRSVAALCIEPTVVAILGLIGVVGISDLFVGDFGRISTSSGVFLSMTHGPLYNVHLLYVSALLLVGSVVMGRLLVRGDGNYRRGTVVLLSAASIPVFAFAMQLLGPFPRFDVTPIALGLSSIVVLFGLRSDDLFDVTPVARDYVFSEMRDGMVVLDDRGRVVELNPAALPLFTVPQEEIIGSHIADICHNSLGMYALLDADRSRLDITVEDDGEKRYYEATATPLGSGEGHDRGWALVLRDTTERRRTEAKFRTLIENSRDLISVLDADGNHTYASPASKHVLGIPRSELEGSNSFKQIHPDDREDIRSQFDTVESRDTIRAEFRHKHADGSWRVLDAVAVNLLDDPAVGGIVVNARDVTSRHRYEQRLRVLNRILRHDLRNDMNVILGHADLLGEMMDDPKRRAHVKTIQQKAESLVSLGERAREIDRTLHGEDRERRPVEVTDVIAEKLEAMQESNPSLVVNTHLPDEQWVLATNHVGTAITNVVDNALEHNDRAIPRVGISVSKSIHTDEVEIRVVDNGPGIPASELAALEAGTETQLQHVSGLGLWLVKWILAGSHATIEFEERSGRGTAVVMRFQPASPPERDEQDESAEDDTTAATADTIGTESERTHGTDETDETRDTDEADERSPDGNGGSESERERKQHVYSTHIPDAEDNSDEETETDPDRQETVSADD